MRLRNNAVFAPTSAHKPELWPVHLVRLANFWEAKKLHFEEHENKLRVRFYEVSCKELDLRELVSKLEQKVAAPEEHWRLQQLAIWSAICAVEGEVILAVGQEAVSVQSEEPEWGQARIPDGQVLLQLCPGQDQEFLTNFFRNSREILQSHCCSDSCRIQLEKEELGSFFLESPEFHTKLGLWAHAVNSEDEAFVPLGKSFEGLPSSGTAANEIGEGVFRTSLVSDNSPHKNKARVVIRFTHGEEESPSEIVLLSHGYKAARFPMDWPGENLSITVFKPAPKELDWDASGLVPQRGEELSRCLHSVKSDLSKSLSKLVEQYNSYSPGLSFSTLGCWGALVVGGLGIAGLAAPLLGSEMAAFAGCVCGLLLVYAEVRNRHQKRFVVGQSLIRLAEHLENQDTTELWLQSEGMGRRPISEPS